MTINTTTLMQPLKAKLIAEDKGLSPATKSVLEALGTDDYPID